MKVGKYQVVGVLFASGETQTEKSFEETENVKLLRMFTDMVQ